jgi:hypothetical protein
MQNKTLNNIVDRLQALSVQHTMLEDFNCGNTADIGTKTEDGRDLKYPYLHVDYSSTNYAFGTSRGIGYKVYTMTLIVLDKISTNITVATETMSDTESILADVVQFASTDSSMRDFRIQTTDINALPVADNTDDGTQGWTCELGFKVPYDWCSSALPIEIDGALPVPPDFCPVIVDLLLRNSDASFVTTITGNTPLYVLADTTYNINIDGVITTTTIPTLKNETINIVWQ